MNVPAKLLKTGGRLLFLSQSLGGASRLPLASGVPDILLRDPLQCLEGLLSERVRAVLRQTYRGADLSAVPSAATGRVEQSGQIPSRPLTANAYPGMPHSPASGFVQPEDKGPANLEAARAFIPGLSSGKVHERNILEEYIRALSGREAEFDSAPFLPPPQASASGDGLSGTGTHSANSGTIRPSGDADYNGTGSIIGGEEADLDDIAGFVNAEDVSPTADQPNLSPPGETALFQPSSSGSVSDGLSLAQGTAKLKMLLNTHVRPTAAEAVSEKSGPDFTGQPDFSGEAPEKIVHQEKYSGHGEWLSQSEIERLLEQIAEHLEFELLRSYGTSGR